ASVARHGPALKESRAATAGWVGGAAHRRAVRAGDVDHHFVPVVQRTGGDLGVLVVGDAGLEADRDQLVPLGLVGAPSGPLLAAAGAAAGPPGPRAALARAAPGAR